MTAPFDPKDETSSSSLNTGPGPLPPPEVQGAAVQFTNAAFFQRTLISSRLKLAFLLTPISIWVGANLL